MRMQLRGIPTPPQREGFSKFNKIYEFDFSILGKVGVLIRMYVLQSLA